MTGANKKRLNFPVLIFFVFLLFTFQMWDHYLNSESMPSRLFISNLILIMGVLLSFSFGYFAWSLEAVRIFLEKEVKTKSEALHEKEGQLILLQGIIPICSYCKNIRNDEGAWQKMETYIQNHMEAKFSHGICKECVQKQAWKK